MSEANHPLKRLKRIIRELEQMLRDIRYYNELNPDQSPIDNERERVALSLAWEAQQRWDDGQRANIVEPLLEDTTRPHWGER